MFEFQEIEKPCLACGKGLLRQLSKSGHLSLVMFVKFQGKPEGHPTPMLVKK